MLLRIRIIAATAVAGLIGVASPIVLTPAVATPPVDETFIPLAIGRVDQSVQARAVTDGWKMRIGTNGASDVLTAQVVHPPGSSSGQHKHAGPVIVTVVEGTLTFYFGDDPTCSTTPVHAGQTVVEQGGARDPAHYAVNEGSDDATVFVTMFAPTSVFPRIDVPAPGQLPVLAP